MEETNGNDIQSPGNVDSDTGDSAGIHPASDGTAHQVEENNIVHTDGASAGPIVTVVGETDLGASKPVPEPKPTLKQVKEWRAANFTVRHSTVNACGHKLDLKQPPSNANCWPCWEAFFSVSPEGVASVHQLLLEGGTQAVVAMHGSKFRKMFGKFLQKKLLQAACLRHERAVQEACSIEGSIMNVKEEINATQLPS